MSDECPHLMEETSCPKCLLALCLASYKKCAALEKALELYRTESVEAWQERARYAKSKTVEQRDDLHHQVTLLTNAVRAAMLHLMVRPENRIKESEDAVKALLREVCQP